MQALASVHFTSHYRRIQIEDHPVRRMDIIDRRAPRMYLNDAHWDHLHDALGVLQIDMFITAAFVLPHKRDGGAEAGS